MSLSSCWWAHAKAKLAGNGLEAAALPLADLKLPLLLLKQTWQCCLGREALANCSALLLWMSAAWLDDLRPLAHLFLQESASLPWWHAFQQPAAPLR